jgi:cell division protein FtsL
MNYTVGRVLKAIFGIVLVVVLTVAVAYLYMHYLNK